MKTAKEFRNLFSPAVLGLALLAAASLALVGCGDLNDNPDEGGLTVSVDFSNLPQPASSGSDLSGQAITFTGEGEAVVSVVVGAIVITHTPVPYSTSTVINLTPSQRELLETDAEQSIGYLEIVQLPHAQNTVSFPIPPANAGPWQLIAVGMRHQITALDQIENNSPIWYGFIDKFLNNVAVPGQVLEEVLTLQPACNIEFPPLGNSTCGT